MTSPGTGEAAQQALEALRTNLKARGIVTHMDAGSLAVLTLRGDQVDTITCKPRVIDAERLWYFDCTDEPIAEARDVIGAAVVIVGHMARGGHRVW